MTLLPIPDYAPDQSDYEGTTTKTLLNVVPLARGYGPFRGFNALTAALPSAVRGFFYARKNDGSVQIFAATSTRIFTLNNTDFTWKPVSKVVALTSISNASPAVFTLNAHGLANDDAIVLSTSGALPTGLVVGTTYYVISSAANTFSVSLTVGGAAINTSGAGSGTHSMTYVYTAVTTGDQWQFAQFNNFVFAVQINSAPQVFNLTSSTAFADLGGSPPQARYVAVVNRFLFLSGLGSSTPYRVQWSAFNDTTGWTAGTNQSDFQDLPDGGIVRGVAGGEFGYIFQDNAIRRLVYAPGSTVVFVIERITDDKGIFAPLSIVRGGDRVFYIGSDGFKMLLPGGYPMPIGFGKVDNTFFADVDTGSLGVCIGASDPKAGRVYWAYRSATASTSGQFNKIIGYDWNLERFFLIEMTGEYLASLAQPGLTLENLDTINSSIDALTFSLDDVATAAFPNIAATNASHKIGFFSGDTLEATAVTAEKGGDGRRLRIHGFRPVTDSATAYGSIYKKDTSSASATLTGESAKNAIGICPLNVSTRYARAKVRIPAATTWTYILGVEPEVSLEGGR